MADHTWLEFVLKKYFFFEVIIYIGFTKKREDQRLFATFRCNYQRMLIPIQKRKNL